MSRAHPTGVLLCAAALAAAVCYAPSRAAADDLGPRWSVSAKGGVSAFLEGQSLALGHILKPTVRVELGYRVIPRLSVSAELVAAATPDSGYRLIGGYLNGRVHLYEGGVFGLHFVAGGGIGSGPPILFDDLLNESVVAAWMQAGLQFRWAVAADLLDLGLDLMSENISMVSANVVVQVRF